MHPSDLKSLPVMSCAVCRTCRRDPFGGCVAGGPFNGYRYKEVTMGGSKAEPAYKSPYPEPSQIGSNSKAQQQAAVTNGVLAASTPSKTESSGGVLGASSSPSSAGSSSPATYG